jgi:hypothetical protein
VETRWHKDEQIAVSRLARQASKEGRIAGMPTARHFAPLVTAFLLILLPGCGKSDPLQGTWRATSVNGRKTTLMFGPGNVVRSSTGIRGNSGTYQVDWAQNPPLLDIQWSVPGGSLQSQLHVQVKGDSLTVHSNSPVRPSGSGPLTMTFQRQPQENLDRFAAPLISAFLLLLPLLYVGSYMGLLKRYQLSPTGRLEACYLSEGFYDSAARCCYWPLEQCHRWVRPGDWEPLLTEAGSFGDRRLQP